MALTYQPPGVNISEIVGTNVTPTLANPTTVCIIGPASGVISGREQLTLQDGDADNNPLTPNAPVPVALKGLPSDATLTAVVEVRDVFSGKVYASGTDYTVNAAAKTITRLATGAITSGTVVRVAYTYRPENYFVPTRYSSLQAIEERYGSAWTDDGLAINSVISHGALVALENGASFVVVAPLFVDEGGTPTQPSAAQAASVATWKTTLEGLRDFEDINVIVPMVGQRDTSDNTTDIANNTVLSIFNTVQDHVFYMRTQDQFVLAVFGEDSSAGVEVTPATLTNHASALQGRYDGDVSEQLILVSPARFIRGTIASNQTMYVGGQYAAAAIAGMMASSRVEAPLTRRTLSGILQVADRRTKEEKNAEASAGICVVEQRGGNVRVRHGVTLDNTSVARREISVVRSKQFMVETLFNTFENQIIGQVAADTDAPDIVRAAVVGTLERLRSLNVLSRYRGVSARLLENDPTTVEVRFSYQPLFPINFIEIVFSIDFSQGTFTNVIPGAR
jgi:hypothetical protein